MPDITACTRASCRSYHRDIVKSDNSNDFTEYHSHAAWNDNGYGSYYPYRYADSFAGSTECRDSSGAVWNNDDTELWYRFAYATCRLRAFYRIGSSKTPYREGCKSYVTVLPVYDCCIAFDIVYPWSKPLAA